MSEKYVKLNWSDELWNSAHGTQSPKKQFGDILNDDFVAILGFQCLQQEIAVFFLNTLIDHI